ncbi:MAG: metallophosphatase family protein [Alphaproteobacteria bacterium]|nr:metallophosphatase family protein [Alphaproteobacteria bacterium]
MTERLDLGDIAAPMLLFGGPYGNRQALDALFEHARRRGIPPARMLCTGDLAAYAADPQAVVDRIRDAGVTVVMGNVEESLGSAAADCHCGFEKGSECDLMAAQWYRYAVGAVTEDAKAWMQTLPRRVDFRLGGRRFAAIHGGVTQINRFVFPSTPDRDLDAELDAAACDAVIGGHSGLPFTRRIGARLWHNAGVVGLPANDGTPRVWYSVLTPQADGIAVQIRALDYDHRAAAAEIRAADLPAAYADSLESGLWPTDDVMPDADRARRGLPLAPHDMIWPAESQSAAAD